MPHAYSEYELKKVYREIDSERIHECKNCGCRWPLSHSHLIKKSWSGKLAVVKDNIVYHCMTTADKAGCHDIYESLNVATMKDFEDNFRIIYSLDNGYFWLRVTKLMDHWRSRAIIGTVKDVEIFERVQNLFNEYDKIENPPFETMPRPTRKKS